LARGSACIDQRDNFEDDDATVKVQKTSLPSRSAFRRPSAPSEQQEQFEHLRLDPDVLLAGDASADSSDIETTPTTEFDPQAPLVATLNDSQVGVRQAFPRYVVVAPTPRNTQPDLSRSSRRIFTN
jgi:hypothetical protein